MMPTRESLNDLPFESQPVDGEALRLVHLGLRFRRRVLIEIASFLVGLFATSQLDAPAIHHEAPTVTASARQIAAPIFHWLDFHDPSEAWSARDEKTSNTPGVACSVPWPGP